MLPAATSATPTTAIVGSTVGTSPPRLAVRMTPPGGATAAATSHNGNPPMLVASRPPLPMAHQQHPNCPQAEAGPPHSVLEITQQPPSTWYKDQFGRKATFDVRVRRTSHGCFGCVEQRHLSVQVLYESGKLVENQNILRVASGLCLGKDDQSLLAIRIMEVSKNHQNQKFRLQISLPHCPLRALTTGPSSVISDPVLVLSKKNKRPVKPDGVEAHSKTAKKSKNQGSPLPGVDDSASLSPRAPPAHSFDDMMGEPESSWADEMVRFKEPTENLCLWANAAYNFLYRLQWKRYPSSGNGNHGNVPFGCPVCHKKFSGQPQHDPDCDLGLLLEQTETVHPTSTVPSNRENVLQNAAGGCAALLPPRPTVGKTRQQNSFVENTKPRRIDVTHPSNHSARFGTSSMDLLTKNLNISSWEGYSSLSKIMFSLEAEVHAPATSPHVPSKNAPSMPTSFGSGAFSMTSAPQLSVSLSSFVKDLSPDTAAFLQEQDAELTGDASLLKSLSKVSLSDFLADANGDPPGGDEEGCAQMSSFSAIMLNDVKNRVPENSVDSVVAVNFEHCGCPAFDASSTLIGFYYFIETSNPPQLQFLPHICPLPPRMMEELEEKVVNWRKEPDMVHYRTGPDPDALTNLKDGVMQRLLHRP